MVIKQIGDKPERGLVTFKSDEATATIPKGTPVCLTMDGTDDGLAAILPSGSAAKAHALAFGISTDNVLPGAIGYAVAYGFVSQAVVLLQTRAATTDAWSASTHSLGVMLNIDTVNNAVSTSGGTLAKTGYLPWGVLAQSSAVTNAAASTTSDTRTVITGYMKAFVRML